MMKKVVLALILISRLGYGQNLVPNPSFEVKDSCPSGFNQIGDAVGWFIARETPDYFNTCATYPGVSIPSNNFGYQYPASGNAYAGFYAKDLNIEYREFLGARLITPLQIGTKYFVSFKVNLSWVCGVNKIGALFSTVQYSYATPALICNCAHIYTDSIITDTLNWIRIKGSFIADSSYTYINIGNLFDDSHTDSIQLQFSNCVSYYYIDDVCVSNDAAYSYNYTYLGINNVNADESFEYYPNPATDFITVKGDEKQIGEFQLYNLVGCLLRTYKVESQPANTIDISDLPSGMYILSTYLKKKKSINKLIIKL
jgi:hypothetical protein